MSKLVVMYKKPSDPQHFAHYFRETHMPLVEKMPGLQGSSYGPATDLEGRDGPFFWMFVGTFASLQAINDALASPEGRKTVADIPNYSKEPPTILHLDA